MTTDTAIFTTGDAQRIVNAAEAAPLGNMRDALALNAALRKFVALCEQIMREQALMEKAAAAAVEQIANGAAPDPLPGEISPATPEVAN